MIATGGSFIAFGSRWAAVYLVSTADASVEHAAGIPAMRHFTASLVPLTAISIRADGIRFRGITDIADITAFRWSGPWNRKKTAFTCLLFCVALVVIWAAVDKVWAADTL
jgi:hypothetical protein